jgi:hypothetical protein
MKSYHNTTNEIGFNLAQSNAKALTQDECVLAYFKDNDNLGATPERVLRHFQIREKLSENRWVNTPITSMRRSFSNLSRTEDALGNPLTPKIYKTDMTIMGDWGKEIHVWKLCK